MADLTAASLFNVKGWVAVVTGGGTGLGLITARTLCTNGVRVYITGRRVEKLKAAETTDFASGGSIVGVPMDVTSKDSIAAGVASISAKEKSINLLVNNAGISSVNYGPDGAPAGDIASISAAMFANQGFENWVGAYRVNTAAYYFCAAAFLPLLCAAEAPGRGSIINISSISGLTKDSQWGQFAYNAAKAATVSLTNMLAKDLGRPEIGVRVNQIAPGYFPSEMTPIDRYAHRPKQFFRDLGGYGIPIGRAGGERDYAQAILHCAVNEYMTGGLLLVDGGWMLAHA